MQEKEREEVKREVGTFKEYKKIGKFGSQECDGILEGEVFIMPKLDGTNASIWEHPNWHLCAGSRKRQLSLEADNAGFCKYATESDELQAFLMDNPRYRLYGEWLVPHTIKGYLDEAWRNFYVYDVWDNEEERYLKPTEYSEMLDKYGIETVPWVCLQNPTVKDVEEYKEKYSTYLCKEGETGEGIVVKNYEFINKFGNCTFGKWLNDSFENGPKGKRPKPSDNQVESDLAELMVTKGLCDKTLAKLQGVETKALIPRYLETVWHDVVQEELYEAVKKMKMPTVKTKALKAEVYKRAKGYAKELF